MDGSSAYLDAGQRIMNLSKTVFGDKMRAYFIGSPTIIPLAAMPCLIVQKVAGKYEVGPTMADDVTEVIMIHILVNGAEGFGTPETDDTVMRELQTLIEGRDPTTGYMQNGSLLYILRNNITLNAEHTNGTFYIDNDIQINYDVTDRQDQPTLVEAIVTVTVTGRVVLPNRGGVTN